MENYTRSELWKIYKERVPDGDLEYNKASKKKLADILNVQPEEKKEKKAGYVLNPKTNRFVKKGGATYRRLLKSGIIE